MANDSRDRVWQLLQKAAELTQTEREALLRRECAGDSDLRAKVERLLREYDDPTPEIDRGAAGLVVFARRHLLGVAVTGVVAASLVFGLVSTAWMALEASRARDEARLEAEIDREVSAFLSEMLAEPTDPTQGGEKVPALEIKVVDVLDEATGRLERSANIRPEVRATLLHTLGTTFLHLSMYDRARSLLEESLTMRRSALGEEDPLTLAAAHDLAEAYRWQRDQSSSAALLEPVLEARIRVLGAEHPDTLSSMSSLAELRLMMGELEAAEHLFRDALTGFEHEFGRDDERTITTTSKLGSVLNLQGRNVEAESLHLRALDDNRRVFGDQHPQTIASLNNLASLQYTTGQLDASTSTFSEALRLSRQVHGVSDQRTLNITANLGAVQLRQGRLEEAEENMRQALTGCRDHFGEEHPRTLLAAHNLARCLTQRGALPEALDLYETLLPVAVQVLPVGDRTLPLFRMGPGIVLTRLGRYDEAEAELELSLSAFQEYFGPDNSHTRMAAGAMAALAEARGGLGE